MKTKTKSCKILFTSIITLNLHLFLMLVLSLIIALFNSYYIKNVLTWWIGFTIAIILLLAIISNILEITQNNIKKIFVFIGYWFFPLSIPYLVLDKDDNDSNEVQENQLDNEKSDYIFLLSISIINLLFASFALFALFTFSILKIFGLNFGLDSVIYFLVVPILLIIGTISNLICYKNPNKTFKILSWLGLTLNWSYLLWNIIK